MITKHFQNAFTSKMKQNGRVFHNIHGLKELFERKKKKMKINVSNACKDTHSLARVYVSTWISRKRFFNQSATLLKHSENVSLILLASDASLFDFFQYEISKRNL
jgi:viroplasmin and RNaseH domain-containing protein